MFGIKKLFLNVTKPSWAFKTSAFVPSNQKQFLQCEAWKPKWVLKYLKRSFYLALVGQSKLILDSIPQASKRILWVNLAAPSLGDSLMDLSARVLLKDFEVDLLTHEKNIALYKEDKFFNKVFSDKAVAHLQHMDKAYDLIILDAFSPKIIDIKKYIAPDSFFVGMWGFINGFEVHRTVYSFYRMQYLLNRHIPSSALLLPTIKPPLFFHAGLATNKTILTIVVGAEWDYRKYDKWVDVVAQIHSWNDGGCQVLLVGSSNGLVESELIQSKFPKCRNFVGQLSLEQTISIIDQSSLILAADGGLWHVACALNKPSVVLFANMPILDIDGKRVTRKTDDMCCEALYAEKTVSHIPYSDIVDAARLILGRVAASNE